MQKVYYIYFLRCGANGGPIKIGYAKNVDKRIQELQVGSPFSLNLLFVIPVEGKSNARRVEAWFHDRYKSKHIRGEWFKSNLNLNNAAKDVEAALCSKDYDQIRVENGAPNYYRDKTRNLSIEEIRSIERIDKLPSKRSWQRDKV